MSEENQKTTKVAKLVGVLSGLGTVVLGFYLVLLIAVGLVEFTEIKGRGFVETILWILWALSVLPAIFVGVKVNRGWEGFTMRKKITLNVISLLPVLSIAFFMLVLHGQQRLVHFSQLEKREGIHYLKGSDTPYTGKAISLYESGQKEIEVTAKDGKLDGLFLGWHKNGQKAMEENFKAG
ncbi:MAG: hypothetical protein GY915_05175, partial [bacterium]|nr:hypothetical protein [bacterium]